MCVNIDDVTMKTLYLGTLLRNDITEMNGIGDSAISRFYVCPGTVCEFDLTRLAEDISALSRRGKSSVDVYLNGPLERSNLFKLRRLSDHFSIEDVPDTLGRLAQPKNSDRRVGLILNNAEALIREVISADSDIAAFVSEDCTYQPGWVPLNDLGRELWIDWQNATKSMTHAKLRDVLEETKELHGSFASAFRIGRKSRRFAELDLLQVQSVSFQRFEGPDQRHVWLALLDRGSGCPTPLNSQLNCTLYHYLKNSRHMFWPSLVGLAVPFADENRDDQEQAICWRLSSGVLDSDIDKLKKFFGGKMPDLLSLARRVQAEYALLRCKRPFQRSEHENKLLRLLLRVFDIELVEKQWPSSVLRTVLIDRIVNKDATGIEAQVRWNVSDAGVPDKICFTGTQFVDLTEGDDVIVKVSKLGKCVDRVVPLKIARTELFSKDEWDQSLRQLPGWGGENLIG